LDPSYNDAVIFISGTVVANLDGEGVAARVAGQDSLMPSTDHLPGRCLRPGLRCWHLRLGRWGLRRHNSALSQKLGEGTFPIEGQPRQCLSKQATRWPWSAMQPISIFAHNSYVAGVLRRHCLP
jgi:hypothetical protein